MICLHDNERLELFLKAIRSLENQTRKPDEVIAVVDHNPPLLEKISGLCPGISTLSNEGKRGLSGARNTGCKAATSDIVFFLDDDAEADPRWLEGLLQHYADPLVMGAGGLIVPAWPDKRPAWFPEEFDWVIGCSYRGMPTEIAPVRNLIGCNMSFRREVLLALGGFRESLGREGGNAFGCEETDFCIRAAVVYPRSRIVYDPRIPVHHHVSDERVHWRYFRKRCLAEGRSKAVVVARNGVPTGLSNERQYTLKTLPAGVLGGIGASARELNFNGVKRAAAIVAGLFLTLIGYLQYSVPGKRQKIAASAFLPIQIINVELADPADAGPPVEGQHSEYGATFIVARFRNRPVATLELPLIRAGVDASELHQIVASHVNHVPSFMQFPKDEVVLPPVSVVIATHDRPTTLARCLDALLLQDYPDYEILVVDNAPSSNATANMITEKYLGTGKVRYVCDRRPGLGQAHNSGVAKARYDIVAFTDDDVIAEPGWLSALVSGFAVSEQVGCVTGLILPFELETQAQYWTERHGGFGKGFARQIFDLKDHRRDSPLYPYTAGQFGSGANMAFRMSALRKIGNFEAALGAGTIARGGDDLAAFAAVILAGFQIVYEPSAVIWHQHRREEAGMRGQAHGYGIGLGAYLAWLVSKDPRIAWKLLMALPTAVAHLFGAKSEKNLRLPSDYPKALVWRERYGILKGPMAYFRSVKSLRRPLGPHMGDGMVKETQNSGAGSS